MLFEQTPLPLVPILLFAVVPPNSVLLSLNRAYLARRNAWKKLR